MTVRIFTFGWSPEFVIRPLVEEGASRDDVILLLSSSPETDYMRKRVEEAYNQVRLFTTMVGIDRLYYREVDVNRDFIEICRSIIRVINEISSFEDKHIFYLTGGMRVLVVAALSVARLLSLAGFDVHVKLSREDRPVTYEVPIEIFRITLDLTEQQIELLKYLKSKGEGSFEDLAIGRSEVTVRKLLNKLEKKGLVKHRASKKKYFFRLTSLGELVLELAFLG